MLPEMELRRANGETDERIVGPDGFAVDPGYLVNRNRNGLITLNLTLSEEGIAGFTDAVESASESELRGEFFRPVVDDETFQTFSISETFATQIENGDWDGRLTISFAPRTDGKATITRLTGLPPFQFHFET